MATIDSNFNWVFVPTSDDWDGEFRVTTNKLDDNACIGLLPEKLVRLGVLSKGPSEHVVIATGTGAFSMQRRFFSVDNAKDMMANLTLVHDLKQADLVAKCFVAIRTPESDK